MSTLKNDNFLTKLSFFLFNATGPLSITVVTDIKSGRRENQSGSLFCNIQNNENLSFTVVKFQNTKFSVQAPSLTCVCSEVTMAR